MLEVIKVMHKDTKVIYYGLIVAGCNGIGFSFYAEGPFFLMEVLNMQTSDYGLSYIIISLGSLVGGFVAKYLQNKH